MIDLHTHTFLSDGALGPSELVRRANVKGYRAIGLTDHADGSNIDFIIPRIQRAARELNRYQETLVIPGIEITHAPPEQIPDLVTEARELGALLVVVHGESPVEPVAPGTNRAAIESQVDILAHPGYISEQEVRLAAQAGVYLEITARLGHNVTNGHTARLAVEVGAALVVNTDSHGPGDLIDRQRAIEVLIGAGLTRAQTDEALENNENLFLKFSRILRSS